MERIQGGLNNHLLGLRLPELVGSRGRHDRYLLDVERGWPSHRFRSSYRLGRVGPGATPFYQEATARHKK